MNRNNKRFFGGYMARINCPHCGGKLFIEASKQITVSVRDVWGTCNNPICLARPVMTISHKSDRTPPLSSITGQTGLISKMLDSLPDHDRQLILDQFKPDKKTA